jgi:hypothetical protein
VKREVLYTALAYVLFLVLCLPARAQVSFLQPPPYAGTGNLFVADFNGDGKLDLLTSDGTMSLGSGNFPNNTDQYSERSQLDARCGG